MNLSHSPSPHEPHHFQTAPLGTRVRTDSRLPLDAHVGGSVAVSGAQSRRAIPTSERVSCSSEGALRVLLYPAGIDARNSDAMPAAHARIASQSRRSWYSGGVFLAIACSIGPRGLTGRRPPNTTCSRAPRRATCSIIFGGSSQDGSASLLGSPTGPELNTQNGRWESSLSCLRRHRRASA